MTTAPSQPTLTYAEYLRLDRLLDLQLPRGTAGPDTPAFTDEYLFIAVHQVHELWFQLLLGELSCARDLLLAGAPEAAESRLRRCHEIERALLGTIALLDTMAPRDFHSFRAALGSASGAQSAQFHEVELVAHAGGSSRSTLNRMRWLSAAERDRLERRLDEPTLWDGFLGLLAKEGHRVDSPGERCAALCSLSRSSDRPPLARLADALLDFDQGWSLWRARHVLAVERQIGRRPGTGGSSGADHLDRRAEQRLFPELWHSRSLV